MLSPVLSVFPCIVPVAQAALQEPTKGHSEQRGEQSAVEGQQEMHFSATDFEQANLNNCQDTETVQAGPNTRNIAHQG